MGKKYTSGGWTLDTNRRLLSRSEQKIVLEPRVMALLVYFLENPQRTINRDELVDNVWQGTSVSESAINWTIAQLRKALLDTQTPRQYIQTLSKQGYQWLQPVNISEPGKNEKKPPTGLQDDDNGSQRSTADSQSSDSGIRGIRRSSIKKYEKLGYGLVVLSFAIIIAVLLNHQPQPELQPLQGIARPFTSMTGAERHPSFSPDGRWLAFTHYEDKSRTTQLMIKAIKEDIEFINYDNQNKALPKPSASQRLVPERVIGTAGRFMRTPSWAPHSKKLAYMRWHDSICQIRLISFSADTQTVSDEVVHQCHEDGSSQVSWGVETESFYFTDRVDGKPYQVFRFDLASMEAKAITNVEPFQNGVFLVRMSPTERKALIVKDIENRISEFHLLDLESDTSEHLFSRKGIYYDVDWNASGTAFFFNQAQQNLYRFDLSSNNISLFYSSSSNEVYGMTQSPDLKQYAFVNASANRNRIDLVTIENTGAEPSTSIAEVLVDSSFQERSPTFSHDGKALFFESDRSGIPQIWRREESGIERQLSNITEFIAIGSIKLSQNDKHLVGEADAKIRTLDIPNETSWIHSAVDVKSVNPIFVEKDKALVFSQLIKGTWQLVKVPYTNKIEEPEILTQEGGYYSAWDGVDKIYFSRKDQCGLYSLQLFDKTIVSVNEEICVANNSMAFVGGYLYYADFQALVNGIYRWRPQDVKAELVFNRELNRGFGFSVNSKTSQLAVHRYNKIEADLFLIDNSAQ